MSLRLKERRIDSFGSRSSRNSNEASTRRSAVALPAYLESSIGLTPTSWVDLDWPCSTVTRYFAVPTDWTEIFGFIGLDLYFVWLEGAGATVESGNKTFGVGKIATG